MEYPKLQQVENINLSAPSEDRSEDGVRYIYKMDPGLEIVKIDLVFSAGRKFENKQMVSKLTSNMLKLGTVSLSAEAFAEQFEFYGTELKLREGFNFISFSVSFVKRHFEQITDLLIQCVTQPRFSQDEFDKLKRRLIQQLKMSLKKSDVVAFRLFTEAIFGEEHPYGYNSTADSINEVTLLDVQQHFSSMYVATNCSVFLHGGIDTNQLKSFKQKMKALKKVRGASEQKTSTTSNRPVPGLIRKQISTSNLQSSIRIGAKLFARSHQDWNDFYMLNMILGGYFGARLSQNLRGKNGITYGAYSSMETYIDDGYWYIHTDVDKAMVEKAIHEIKYEIQYLLDHPIDEDELAMVKSYTKGTLLMTIDGVFAQSAVIKDIYLADMDVNHYNQIIQDVEKVDAKRLQSLAQQYWDKSRLITVIVD